jgi:hypothetical protein
MRRAGVVMCSIMLVLFFAASGCNGGDGGNGGGTGTVLNILGTWSGPMTHRIIDHNRGTDTTLHYTVTFYILSERGNAVSGKMELRDASHMGYLSGHLNGNRFTGVRTGLHTVQISFDVNGDTLTGTFNFVGDGLDETGTYTCTRQ